MTIFSSLLVICTAIMSGVFFAFSSFVMTALSRVDTAEGIRVMQRINVDVLNPSFLSLFLGLPLILLSGLVMNLWFFDSETPLLLTGASVLYLAGCFGVTVFKNVPLNDALAKVDSDTTEGRELWKHYLSKWTYWNHVRTAACALTSALLLGICFA